MSSHRLVHGQDGLAQEGQLLAGRTAVHGQPAYAGRFLSFQTADTFLCKFVQIAGCNGHKTHPFQQRRAFVQR